MTMTVDPEQLRALAGRLDDRAERIAELDPCRLVPAEPSALGAATRLAAETMAVAYRDVAAQCRVGADTVRANAAEYLASDQAFAGVLRRAGSDRS